MSRNRMEEGAAANNLSPRAGVAVQELINSFEREENPSPNANWLEPAGPDQLPQCCARDLKSFTDFRNRIGELWRLNAFHSKSPFDHSFSQRTLFVERDGADLVSSSSSALVVGR
jgi:hypothetical protein